MHGIDPHKLHVQSQGLILRLHECWVWFIHTKANSMIRRFHWVDSEADFIRNSCSMYLRARVKSEVNCKQRGTHDGYLESQPGA